MGSNNFIAFATIPAGAQVGEQPAVDLWTLVPATGLDPGFNLICVGEFIGTIAIEGSLDGVQFNPLGFFTLGNGQAGNSFELSPVVVNDVVRYVRARVMPGTYIQEAVFLTAGGSQNCDCSGGGGGAVTRIIAGTGIGVSPPAGTGDVTVSNTGVTQLIAGPGVTVDQPTGVVTIGLAATLAAIFDYGEANTPEVSNLMTGPLQRMFINLGTTPPPFPPNAQPFFPESGAFLGEFPADSGLGADAKPLWRLQRHFSTFPSVGEQIWYETQYDLFAGGINQITGGDRSIHWLIDQFDNRLTFCFDVTQLDRPGLFPENISPIYLDSSPVTHKYFDMMDALGGGNTNRWGLSSDGNLFRRGFIPNQIGPGGGPPGPWKLVANDISMWSRNGGEPLIGSELFYEMVDVQTFGINGPDDQHIIVASSAVLDAKNLGSGQAAGHGNWYARSELNTVLQLIMQSYSDRMSFVRKTEWQAYPLATDSTADTATARFNPTSQRLDLSNNTSPYSRILTQADISPTPSPLSASPVTDVVSTVQDLTTATLFTVVLNETGRKFLPISAYVEFVDVDTLTVGPSIKLGNNVAHDNVAPVLAVPNTVVTEDTPLIPMAANPVMIDLNTNSIDCEVTVNATATTCLGRIHLIGTYPPIPVADTPPLANLLQWVKGDAGVTQAGGFVSVWADQSGNGNDLVQATGANQPTYDGGATINIEGIPAISFDSGNQELTAFGLVIPDPSSVFIVYKRNSTGANGRLVDWNFPTANMRIQSSNPPYFQNDDGGGGHVDGVATPLGETIKLLVVRTGVAVDLYQMDFDTATDTDAMTHAASTGIGIGGLVGFSQGADSTIVEFGVYSSALNATERAQLQAYLDLRYPG